MPQSSGFLADLWIGVGTHLWQTSLVLVALLVAARALRRAPAGVVNALLLAGLAKLLLPLPLLKSYVGGAVDSILNTVSASPVMSPVLSVTSPVVVHTSTLLDPMQLGGPRLASGLQLAMTLLWAVGAGGLAALWLARSRSYRTPETTPLATAPPDVASLVTSALRATGIPGDAVLVTDEPVVPHVTGLARPKIVVPAVLARGVPEAELRCVLLHEDAHRRRWEPARALLARAAAVLFFFYPLLWPLIRRLRETGEMVCDDAALAAGAEPRAYVRALAAVFDMGLNAAPGSAVLDRNSPSLLRRRLERLNEPWRYRMHARHRVVLSIAAVCVLLASALALTSVAGDPTTDAAAPEAPAKPAPKSDAAPECEPEEPEAPEGRPLPEEFYIKEMVPPEYPEEARAAGVEAIVLVELYLDDEHKVADAKTKAIVVGRPPLEKIKMGEDGKIVEPVEEEGMEVYHEAFIESALKAVRLWALHVTPENARLERPAAVVPIQFRLDGESGKPPKGAR